MVSSAPYTLMSNGHTGYVLYYPVAPPGATAQALLAVGIDVGVAFAAVVGNSPVTYSIRITDATAAPGTGQLYAAGGDAVFGSSVAPVTRSYSFLNRTWTVVVAPSADFLESTVTWRQRNAIAIGVPLAFACGECLMRQERANSPWAAYSLRIELQDASHSRCRPVVAGRMRRRWRGQPRQHPARRTTTS